MTNLLKDIRNFLTAAAQMFDEMKVERGSNWTSYNQSQRERITELLRRIDEGMPS